MGSDDRDSAVYAPFDAIKSHYGYLHRIKDIGEALQLAPKVNNLQTGSEDGSYHYCRDRSRCVNPFNRSCGRSRGLVPGFEG